MFTIALAMLAMQQLDVEQAEAAANVSVNAAYSCVDRQARAWSSLTESAASIGEGVLHSCADEIEDLTLKVRTFSMARTMQARQSTLAIDSAMELYFVRIRDSLRRRAIALVLNDRLARPSTR